MTRNRKKRRSHGSRSRPPDRQWTVEDVREMLHNPIYAGLGPFPPLIDDQTFIGAMKVNVKEDGARQTLEEITEVMEKYGMRPSFATPDWIETACIAIAQGPDGFFLEFLAMLRQEFPPVPYIDVEDWLPDKDNETGEIRRGRGAIA